MKLLANVLAHVQALFGLVCGALLFSVAVNIANCRSPVSTAAAVILERLSQARIAGTVPEAVVAMPVRPHGLLIETLLIQGYCIAVLEGIIVTNW